LPNVLFLPDNVEIQVDEGENLFRAALGGQVHLYAACGGAGTCGKCRVRIDSGEVLGGKSSKLSQQDLDDGYVLACLSKVIEDIVVTIPEETSLTHIKPPEGKRVEVLNSKVLKGSDFEESLPSFEEPPAVRKFYLEVSPPSLEEPIADKERLERALVERGIESTKFSLGVIRESVHLLRDSDWKITVTILGQEVIQIEPGDTTATLLGVAMDIGTTTCAAELIDLPEGRVVANATAYNAQIAFGDDVITRIVHARDEKGLTELRDAVLKTVNELLAEVSSDHATIIYLSLAGNTTMTQLLLGIPPKYIREEPYVPSITDYGLVPAVDSGIAMSPKGMIAIAPCVASYVGGDIVAGVLATSVADREPLTLFVDMGTNGEMVLGNREWMMTCACSAGPAFEGGGIRNGMRAAKGAIELVMVDPTSRRPTVFTVGQGKPIGICGSGIINAISEMYMTGVLGPDGKLDRTVEAVTERDGAPEYVLVEAMESGTGKDIVLDENDIDNFIRAKGAIFAGVTSLLDSVGLSLDAIDQVLIAGGFGLYLDIEKAVGIGLLPDLPLEKFRYVGNGSLLGARLALQSEGARSKAREIASQLTYIELSHVPSYMDHYMSALFIPHTDESLFPSVAKRKSSR